MEKKKRNTEEEPPMETTGKVDRPVWIDTAVWWQAFYEIFKKRIMDIRDFLNAVCRSPFSQGREKEMGKEEEEQEKEENQEKMKKKKKRKSDKVEVLMESSEKVKECEMNAHNYPEHKELVKCIQENLKEMNTKFTDEKAYEMLKQCNMDSELTIQRLLSLEGFEEVKSKRTKKKERMFAKHEQRIDAQWSKSQHEVGSSSILKLGGSVDDDDAGRTDTTPDNTVQRLPEVDSNTRSQLDNGPSPPAAAGASHLPGLNIGKGKEKEVVRSTGDKTTVIPRSHEHASRAGSDPGTFKSELLPTSSEPTIHAEESETRHKVSSGSIVKQGGNCDYDAGRTDKTHDDAVQGLQEADSKVISQLDDVSSPPTAAVSSVASQLDGPNIGNRKGKEVVGSVDDNDVVISRSHDLPLHAMDPLRLHTSSAGSDPRAPRNNVANVFVHQALGTSSSTRNCGERSIWNWKVFMTPDWEKEEIPQAVADAYNNPNPGSSGTWERKLLPTSSEPSDPSEDTPRNLATSSILDTPLAPSIYGPLQRPARMSEHALSGAALGNLLRCSNQSIRNDSPDLPSSPFHHIDAHFLTMMYSSMKRPATMSVDAPPLTPSASIHESSQTLLQGNNLSTGHGFTHPYIEPSFYQPQLPLQHGYMNRDGYMHQNFGYNMTSSQQEVYQGNSSSLAYAGPFGWRSFPGRGSTPHQFLPYSPAPSDNSETQLNSALYIQVQHQYRHDNRSIGTNYNFAAWNNQLDLGAMPAFPEQQQGGLPRWLPLPSDGNNQHHDMQSAQQGVYRGGGSSIADGNAYSWGTIQGTGSTSYQSLPIPPYSPAPFNISWTGHDSTLQAQDSYRNDDSFFILPTSALTPRGGYLGRVPLPANRLAGEGSSQQYVHRGHVSWHHPGTGVRPNHQQQSPYNTSTGNLQDFSTMQPPQDPGP